MIQKTILLTVLIMKKDLFFAAAAVMALVALPVQAQNSRIVEEGGTGPYKAIMMEEPTLTTHTIFRPQDLSKFGKKNLLPVLVWGNGGCANSPSGHINFLNEVASQGFLIVAIGPSNYQQQEAPRPGQTGDVPRMGQGGGMPGGMGGFGGGMPRMGGMGGGMPQMGGGMGGMSCGGLQALHMSADERIKTIMVMNSGFFGTDESEDKASLAKMKQKSVIWILGGSTDIAWENGNDDFKRMSGSMPACLVSLDGIGHGGTYMQPNGGDYAKVAGAWLKWWLKGDKEASTMFTGNEPGVGKMEGWMIERKNIK